MDILQIKIGSQGVIQLPREVLDKMDFEEGQSLEVEKENNSLRASLSIDERIKRAQAIVRMHISEDISLVDELIADRRIEAAND